MPYRLVPDNLSHDVVTVLEELLEHARRGDVTGIAFACTLRRMKYITNVAGHCHRNPTFARGMVASLSDELGRMVRQRDDDETR